MFRRSFITIFFLTIFLSAKAQSLELRYLLEEIAKPLSGKVGVTVVDLTNHDTVSINGNRPFPMQSVFKFHIGLAALKSVEEGNLSLDNKYYVTKDHYFKTWSVMMREYPEANVEVTLEQLITWAVMNSDNVACDMLFDILGGPASVDKFIKGLGLNDVAIVSTERQMHEHWDVQFANWTSPNATATLLQMFFEGRILNADHTKLLMEMMTKTPNAPKRLKGLLPDGTMVARKPGTGGSNGEEFGAVNDVGMIVLPNGKKIVVAAFVTRVKDIAVAEMTIAKMARAVYDHYNK